MSKNFYDLLIIGGGILGFSTAYQLLKDQPGLKVLLLEKESGPAAHQTGHNSGVIHAGVYYKPGSLKAKFCFEGNQQSKLFCEEQGIKFSNLGKLIVAMDEFELERLNKLGERAGLNGLNIEKLDAQESLKLEKKLNKNIAGSLLVKDSAIVDWKVVTRKYQELFKNLGGEVLYQAEVIKIIESDLNIKIILSSGESYQADYLIACSGLQSDKLIKLAGLKPDFKIIPFRGEYFKLVDKYNNLFQHLIYPVPDPELPFLGVHFTPHMPDLTHGESAEYSSGYITVGPNAVLAFSREGYDWGEINLKDMWDIFSFGKTWQLLLKNKSATWNELKSSVCKKYYLSRVNKYCAEIKLQDLIKYPAGVRAQAMDLSGNLIEDFKFFKTKRSLHVCNAPSPAATASLPIGKYIIEEFKAGI